MNRDELTAAQVTVKTIEQVTGNVQQSSQVGAVRGYQPSRRMPQAGKGCQFKGNCYICQQVGHMAKNCLNQYCQLCGKWGHGMKMCKNPSGIKVGSGTASAAVPEETVIVQALIDGKEFETMLNTGAGVSVTDFTSLKRLDLHGKLIKE